jgi:two-component system cell cycle response regulator DivK
MVNSTAGVMKKKILLVEDNPATMDVVEKELEFLGYDTITADDGRKAVEMAEAHMPDVIIMDISLPQMDGLEATALIRENPKTKSIPILAATARALPGDREKCIQGGCNDYIAKPFTHRELGAALKRLLDGESAGT